MRYPGLPRALPRFLAELAVENSRDWFEAHRDAYERDWKAAGLDLIAALGPLCQAGEPRLEAVPRIGGSLKRIQRDTRFSADKAPYAPMLHLVLALPGAEKHRGMHLVVHPDRLGFGAGHYGLGPQALARFRDRVQDPEDRAALLAAAARAEAVGSRWDAPDLKRLPKGMEAEADWEHLLRRKSVILRGETAGLPDWLFTADCLAGLDRLIAAHRPLLGWLAR
ncbi:TIGR02453 family protein [Acidimangrovimonas pyrenivorans]|uniref:TIGR02453 family protein n=1 Tax=Acidimangrovimonas pyrenivorans TaxID=2030798 RepID=A0ABV7ADQ2_9RHOB